MKVDGIFQFLILGYVVQHPNHAPKHVELSIPHFRILGRTVVTDTEHFISFQFLILGYQVLAEWQDPYGRLLSIPHFRIHF